VKGEKYSLFRMYEQTKNFYIKPTDIKIMEKSK